MLRAKPEGVTWTDEQWEAICRDGSNIIVSAGAGSGKTAVLTERVIEKLTNGVNVNELLILTFTKAAASEMKERIREAIKKNPDLKEQLNYIDTAYITTFDSFALSVVKKYHYLLNISPAISIIDESIIRIKKVQLMDEIFEELYQKEDTKFLKMIDDFCTKDDREIRDYLLTISSKLDMLPDKKGYLQNYLSNYLNEEKIDRDVGKFTRLLIDKIEEIKASVEEIYNEDSDFGVKVEEAISNLLSAKTYDEIVINLNIKLPIVPRGSSDELKASKERVSELIKKIKALAIYESTAVIKESIWLTRNTLEVIINILLKFDQLVFDYKFSMDYYEFNDIALLSIKVLRENQEVREELKNSFKEIMIDEYQDTNDLQETFISMIADNNVYMVGDIKQSIYRFRNANPYIFKNKYDNYSQNRGGYKIDLNKNFRSRKEVLDNINIIFNIIMDDLIGGADYITSHQMVFGNKKYIEEGSTLQNNDLEIYTYPFTKETKFRKEEIEAFIIADDIIKKVESKYQVFDKKTSKLRDITYSDFVILIDRTTNFDLYKKVFVYKKIPLFLLKDEKMNDENDILVLKNLFRFIIKIKDSSFDTEFKYLFISLARSFLFEINDKTIFEYFKDNTFKSSEVYLRCQELSKKVDYLSSRELLDEIIVKFDYYDKLIRLGSVTNSLIRLDRLKDLATNLSTLGYDIYGFSNYLEEIIANNYEMKYQGNSDNSDSVKIMTIHKSKGLEYHICYFSGLYNNFNILELKEKFLYSPNYGIIVPYFKEGIGETFYKELLKEDYIKEEISEKIRLFYVALTRAKEKMIMILPKCDKEVNSYTSLVPVGVRNNYRNFKDIIESIESRLKEYYVSLDLDKIEVTKDYNLVQLENFQTRTSPSSTKLEVRELDLISRELEEKSFSKKTHDLIDKDTKKNMELGLKIHEILELIDFRKPNYDLIDNKFYLSKVKKFLDQDLIKNSLDCPIYKEYEFIYDKGDDTYHGIIDLMIEHESYIDIIDYKLKYVDDPSYVSQLNGYRDYIEDKVGKPVNLFLYSIIEDKIVRI